MGQLENKLDLQSTKFNIVLQCKKQDFSVEYLEQCLYNIMKDNSKFAIILHDKDIDDNGTQKTKHFHIIIWDYPRCRLSTMLTRLQTYILCDIFALTIDRLNDLRGGIQYLTHKNDKNKFQYILDDIVTNNQIELETLYTIPRKLDVDTLLSVIMECNFNKFEIARTIGLSYYNLYRNVINDFIKFHYAMKQ